MTLDNKLDWINKAFGNDTEKRFKKLAEECAEFLNAYHHEDLRACIEEGADIHNVIRGLLLNHGNIRDMAEQKADRTIERINDGYYGDRGITPPLDKDNQNPISENSARGDIK